MSDVKTFEGCSRGKHLGAALGEVRDAVMDGLASIDTFAAAIGKTHRTVSSYIARGLPVIYIGRTPYVPLIDGRDWLRARRITAPEPPRRGRPTKARKVGRFA